IPCPLNLDQGTTGPNCSDSNDGTATVTPTDGTMPYVYDWSDDQFDGMDTATGLMAGQSISVTVTDAAGCVGIVDFLLPTPDAIILDCSSIADPTNNTSNDGQADIAVNGGVPPYTVTWTGPVSGSDDLPTEGSYLINGLSVGSYTVMIEDSNGCTTSCNFDLTGANCDLTLDLQGTNPDCAGEASGSLDLFIDGSFPIVSIDWNEDSYDGIEDHVDVPAGTFNVTVIDNQGCVASTSLTLVDPPALFVNCSQTTNPSTNISTDGEVDVVIAGGSAGYTISWAGPVSGSTTAATPGTINIGNLSVGSYTITIEDNNGCTVTCDFVLTTPNTCTFDLVFTTMDETCPEAADGSVFVAPSGATPGFTYNWNTTAATPTIQNLNAGTYIVTVTDANDCVAIDSVTIVTANASPTLLAGMGGSICLDSCFSLPLDLGGQAPFTVDYVLEAGGSMTNAQATFSNALDTLIICPAADGIPPGPFSVNFTRISDANCQTPLTETVSFEYLEPGIEDFMSTICLGDTIMIAGEVFHQTNPSGTVIIPQGASNGCDSIINVTLDFFPLSTFDLGQTICVEDSLFVGGTAFHFNNPTGSVTLENASTNGCDSIVNVDLTFFPVSTFDLMPTICPEDTITVGGQDFHFDNPTGTVILENASASGCDSTVVVDLSFFPPSTLNLAPTICMEDTITVGNEQFFLGNSTGVVILENASSNGCDSTITVNLSFFPASELEITDDICQGDTIIIAGQEFFSGQLSDTIVLDNAASNGCDSTIFVNLVELLPGTTQIQSDLCAGDTLIIDGITFTEDFLQDTIQLAGQASNGCDSLVFVDLNLIPLVATPLAATICSGDSLTVGDSILITTGTYDILIDNGSTNGCDSLVQVALNVLPAISENVTGTFCADESITVGNETFDISNPTGTVLIPDGSINGCDSTVVVDLTFVPAAINDLDTLLCFGESLTIGSQVFDMDNPSGIVVLTNGASSGCDSTIFVNTTYRPELTASLGPDTIVCGDQNLDGILELTPGPLYSFELEFSTGFQLSVDDVAGGQYNFALGPITQNVTVTLNSITAADGCAVTLLDDQANIQYSDAQLSLLSIGGGLGTDISCANEMDGAIQAAISGGIGPFTYQWNTGDDEQILDGLGTGDYSVTVTDLPGCTTEASISLTAPNPINIMLDGNSAGCFGTATGSLSISNISGGTAPYEFSLDNEFFQALDSNLLIPNLAAGPYTVFVQDANDCQFSFNGAVPEALELQLELGDDEVIQVGDSILIKPQIDFAPASWTWTPTNGISQPDTFITFVAPLETTIYQLELVDENGCEVSDLIRIIVEKDIDVFIPTAFSPDGDGTNDLFMIFAGQGVEEVESFQIFDRWGNQVFFQGPFQPNDPLFGWDGTHRGEELNAAVFVYFAEIRLITGETVILEGEVLLLK
ncbi:MAG: gliding motility-associated C-terminal domain-containing protein, partial [Bacteroidota bacterium]